MSKAIGDLNLPENLRYTCDHEWIRQEGDTVIVGVTDYAQDQLGDIVFVELPEVGDTFDQGDEFGTLESVKAVSEVYIPIGGEIVAINSALADTPEQVNGEPYTGGWMIVVKPNDIGEIDALMDQAAYLNALKGPQQ